MKRFVGFLVLVVLVLVGVLVYQNRDSFHFGTDAGSSRNGSGDIGAGDGDQSGGNQNGDGDGDQTSPTPENTRRTGVPDQPAALDGCGQVELGETCLTKGSGFGYGEVVAIDVTNTTTGITTHSSVRADDAGAFEFKNSIVSAHGAKITIRATGQDSGRSAEVSYTLA